MKLPSKNCHDSCTTAPHSGSSSPSPSPKRSRNTRNHDLSLRRLIVPVSLGGLLLVYSIILAVNMILLHQEKLPLSLRMDAYYHRHEQGQSQSGLPLEGKHENRSGGDDKKGLMIHRLNTAAAIVQEAKDLVCSSCHAALTMSCRYDQAFLGQSNSVTMNLPATRSSPLLPSPPEWIFKAESMGKAVWNVTLDCSSCQLGAFDCSNVEKNDVSSPSNISNLRKTDTSSTSALRKTDTSSTSTSPKTDTSSTSALRKTDTSSTSTLPKTDTKTVSPTTADVTATETTSDILDLEKTAPTIRYGATHALASVPARNRLPVTALANLTAYFADSEHVFPAAEYFFEYNPSIVRLPDSYKQQWVQHGSRSVADTPLYLASYRVTNTQQCVTDDLEVAMVGGAPFPRSKNWLGLALLNANLEIVWDLVTDLATQIHNRRIEDYRLFVLHDQIYVTSYALVFPVYLVFANTDSSDNNNKKKRPCDKCIPLPPMDGGNSTSSSNPSVTVWMRDYASCTVDMRTRKKGKNLSYFVDGHNRTILETLPMGSKERVKLDVPCRGNELLGDALNITHNPLVPEPSIATAPKSHALYKVLSDERGSTCCVEIPDTRKHNGNESIASPLLLGVSHSKTRFREYTQQEHGNLTANHFFSSFYAMESTEPYTVVARSGQFCLGFAPAQEADRGQNPYALMNQSPLIIDKAYASCPRIHFVSGMVEKADDPTQVIVAYGINDCVPRMVQVAKVDILRMLFQAPSTVD